MSESEQVVSGWKPIETAPRDGTEILAMFLGRRVIAKWSEAYNCWVGINVVWHDNRGTVQALPDGLGNNGVPDVWMPLPLPPQENE